MIVLATLPGITFLTMIPAKCFAAFHFLSWQPIWQRLANILLRALEMYLEKVVERGFFMVPVPGNQITTVLDNEASIQMAANNGLVYDGHSLTVPQDIVLYVKDDVGVAVQQGEYELDAKGNFNFRLIKVVKPVPSPTFPLPDGSEN